jgi:hypothetical protein
MAGTVRGAGTVAWLIGAGLGALDGFVALEIPWIGLLLSAATAVVLARQRRGRLGVGGLLLTGGAIWLFFLVRAILDCQAFDSMSDHGCAMPDLTPWIAGGFVAIGAGILLTITGLRHRDGLERGPS